MEAVTADLEMAIRKLATLSETNLYERVFVIRQILDNVHRAGYEDGYATACRDHSVADMLAEKAEATDG
ncbi:hypothetical protein [Nonomuraea typhae]|uniref:hypothetical protein n=1 Tax=Nonomuraea typhae TaxID=2603600 RepID=UPI0012FB86E8|nr:hypothetical protein [Nonomuraea typhae]